MTIARRPAPPLFSQVDVSSATHTHPVMASREEQTELLREILAAQDRTNELLEELSGVGRHAEAAGQRVEPMAKCPPGSGRRVPRGGRGTHARADRISATRMTEEINDTSDDMVEGEFMLNEFVDRYGPRLAHLNGVIQVLAQLSSVPNPANSQQG